MKYNNIKSVIQAHDTSVKERKKPKLGIALTVVSSVLIIVGVALFATVTVVDTLFELE